MTVTLPSSQRPSFARTNDQHRNNKMHRRFLNLVPLTIAILTILPYALSRNECSLYLARSTAHDAPNSPPALFTSVSLKRGDMLPLTEIAIPIIDVHAHTPETYGQLIDNLWNSNVVGMDHEGEEIHAGISGAAILAGYHPMGTEYFANMAMNYNSANLRHSRHDYIDGSLRGATSDYWNVSFVVVKDIAAGEELFMSGMNADSKIADLEHYEEEPFDFDSLDDEEELSDELMIDKNIALAEQIVMKFSELVQKEKVIDKTDFFQNDGLIKDLWDVTTEAVDQNVSPFLPQSVVDITYAFQHGVKQFLNKRYSIPVEVLTDSTNLGSVCVDNISVQNSVIYNAGGGSNAVDIQSEVGKGAFAKRNLSQDSIIVTSPLLIIPDGDLGMYEDDGVYASQQLLLNYCLGHARSNVLLYPTGPGMNYINHGPAPNAKLVWPENNHSNDKYHNDAILYSTLDELRDDAEDYQLKLSINVVATRDIQKGEEITIDYGPDWVKAYNHHILTSDFSAIKWTARYSNSQPVLPTLYEYEDYSYQLEEVYTVCAWNTVPIMNQAYVTVDAYEFAQDDDATDFRDIQHKTTLFKWSRTKEEEGEYFGSSHGGDMYKNYHLCKILDRYNDDVETNETMDTSLYTVRMDQNRLYTKNGEAMNINPSTSDGSRKTFVKNVPRYAIQYLDSSYASDMHLMHAFRHFISIPNEVFPNNWME